MEKSVRQLESEKIQAETNALLAKSKLAAYKQNMEQQSVDREKYGHANVTYRYIIQYSNIQIFTFYTFTSIPLVRWEFAEGCQELQSPYLFEFQSLC